MITIGVTTYNRLEILKMMARSLYSSDLCYPYHIRIYDDASTDYSIDTLKKMFPDAVSIFRQPNNCGADANIYYMYKDFLSSDDELFFNADSDLIFSKKWMEEGIKLLRTTDGVLSILNVFSHSEVSACNMLVEKRDIGSAGTFFIRQVVENFIKNSDASDIQSGGVDWEFCRYFHANGIKIFSTSNSLVQHIGIDGYNSDFRKFDYGKGFAVDSFLNGQIINDVVENIAKHIVKKRIPRRIKLFPFDLIPKGSNIVIYGSGMIGNCYEKQIQATNYCNLLATIDKNYMDMEGVKSPRALTSLDFDYILIAAGRRFVIESIEKDILEILPDAKEKIVYTTSSHYLRLDNPV